MKKFVFLIFISLILSSCLNPNIETTRTSENSNFSKSSNSNNKLGNIYENKGKSFDENIEKESLKDNKHGLQGNTDSTKDIIGSNSKTSNKAESNNDKTTYGKIEFIDDTIPYKTIDPESDHTKEKNTSGYITKGENGIKRKEVRKVYINGKYSHTELIKDTYILKEPVHEQKWIGAKEKPPEPEKKPTPPKEDISKPKDKMVINGEIWHLYKSFDNADACISNINRLQDEHYREWEGGSMCWSEDLYYSLGK